MLLITALKKIALIIDDSRAVQNIIASCLKRNEYETVSAYNGADGLEKFKSVQPSLTFLDIIMPGMSGLDVLKDIRALDPTATVIMVTSLISMKILQQAKESKATCEAELEAADIQYRIDGTNMFLSETEKDDDEVKRKEVKSFDAMAKVFEDKKAGVTQEVPGGMEPLTVEPLNIENEEPEAPEVKPTNPLWWKVLKWSTIGLVTILVAGVIYVLYGMWND